jgi:hypothetical protein
VSCRCRLIVFAAERDCNSTLSILRGGFRKPCFAFPAPCRLPPLAGIARAAPGHACSHNDEIHLGWGLFHVARMVTEDGGPCGARARRESQMAARLEGEPPGHNDFRSRSFIIKLRAETSARDQNHLRITSRSVQACAPRRT